MAEFTPFAAKAQSTNFESLNVESDEEKIALYGSLEIRRDQLGLARAKQLHALFGAIVESLEQSGDLPAEDLFVDPRATIEVDNPFESDPQ